VGVHDHGTAVLGEMVSVENGWGMTGIAHGASGTYFSSWSSGGVSAAIYRAIAGVPEGSIIVIEVHISGPNSTGNGQVGYVPAEWSESTYNAVVAAVSNGMIVVAAAGNGAEDLDDPVYSAGSHAPFLPENDSGAIMVGAGGAYPGCSAHLARLGFSCYGSRVDLQGYGECVATLGYGSLFSETNCDYTSSFSGTSSATPIVAGACMLLQSYAQEAFGRPLTAEEMRSVLVATGQPQTGNTSEHIGPLPDVIAAIDALDITPPCIADLNDDGIVDGFDLSRVLGYWGLPGETDLDGSGSTDGADLTILLSGWGTCPG
jgi:subtilisin family serine protease